MNISQKLFMRHQVGLGLVELMIAMLLSILLSGALVQAYIGSRTTYQLQDSMSIVQENGRFALSYLNKELRMAGYIGCGSIFNPVTSTGVKVNNISVGAPDVPVSFDKTQIISAGAPANYVGAGINATAGDVLVIRKASNISAHLYSAANSAANVVLIDNSPSLQVGDYAIISDCTSADLFNITAIGAAGAQVTLSHAKPFLKPLGYGKNAEVLAFESTYYYIANTLRTTKTNLPISSLYMRTRAAGTGGFSNPVELVEGVEDMKIQFGVDDNKDANVDRYIWATDMAAGDWGNIMSVQISLMMQGVDDKAVGTVGSNYAQTNILTLKTKNPIPPDGRLRQPFTAVIAVRNQVL